MQFEHIRGRAQDNWHRLQNSRQPQVIIGMGTCGIAAGARAVLAAVERTLKEEKIPALVRQVGCIGLCYEEPLLDLVPPGGPRISYGGLAPEVVPQLIKDVLKDGKLRSDLALCAFTEAPVEGIPPFQELPFIKPQVRVVTRHCGFIDPENIDEYIAQGGYEALQKALSLSPEEVIDLVKRSKLRGRGGAGFPTGMKWEFCRKAAGEPKYLICNADEGDPGAFMDRAVLEGDPHAVLEGMLIAAYAIGASEGYIYARAEYPLAVRRLKKALTHMTEYALLGDQIMGTDFSFHIKIKEGAGAFVCGEETALMASIEGKRGMPRPRPPFPAQAGLWGKPTNINNVETFANVPAIMMRGPEWFASLGTERSGGTKTFCLTGKVARTGLAEVPVGISLGEVVHGIGGGIGQKRAFKAAQSGGPSGGCIPASLLNLPLDYEPLTQAGSIMGSGGLVIADEQTCIVDLVRFFLSFTQAESCGKCIPCRLGTKQMLEILQDITEGRGRLEDLDQLREIGETVLLASLCGLGQTAPNPVLSTLRYFRDEYEAHIRLGRCPAAVCRALVDSPCQHACPAGVDVPRHIRLMLEGRYGESLAVIRENNPFPAICGRVCDHPCETYCRRAQLDEAVSIRGLRRYISDLVEGDGWEEPPPPVRREEKVAIVGSGPAGLSAAYYLAKMGYPVTVYEALPVAGGMMAVGIPDYRLPKDVLAREIEIIHKLGVEIRTNTPIGDGLTLNDLRQQYRAIFLGVGAHQSQKLGVPGENQEGVLGAVEFLRQVNLGQDPAVGQRVAVVGGGSVAMDAARSALRLGAKKVHIVYRRLRDDMTALKEEIEEALAEGIEFHYLTVPAAVQGDGRVRGLECLRCEQKEFDASGRRRPVPAPGTEFTLEVDTVIAAIGQATDYSFLPPQNGLAVSPRGTLVVDPDTLATGVPGIFAGGDVTTGPATVIEAIAAGHRAAISIDRYLRGESLSPVKLHARMGPKEHASWEVPEEAGQIPGQAMPLLAVGDRRGCFAEVELGFDEATARREALRCLHCDLE